MGAPPRTGIAADAPIFDPVAFRLTPKEAELTARAREFGARVLAPRAPRWDREASFPTDNYRDMHTEGWLGVCVPEAEGGAGAGFRAYCLAAAEFGRYCGATALTWNMHVCSTLWTGVLTDDLDMDPAVTGRTPPAPPPPLRPHPGSRRGLFPALLGRRRGGGRGRRLRHHREARAGRLPRQRQEDLREPRRARRRLRRPVHGAA